MKKRILSFVLVMAMLLSLGEGLIPKARSVTLPSYNAEKDFASKVFGYFARNLSNGVNTELTYVQSDKMYRTSATGSYITSSYLSVGINPAVGSMLVFTAPVTGTITISNAATGGITNKGNQWNKKDFTECYANIYGTDWSMLATYAIPASETAVATADITGIHVEAGQQIRFLAGSNSTMNCYLYWIPQITYTEVESDEHRHAWQETWNSDEDYHWHECGDGCDITDNAQKNGYAKHADQDLNGICDACGHLLTLPGMEDYVYSFADMFSGTQTGVWRYLTRESVSNTYKELTWDGEKWVDGKGAIITDKWLHTSADASDKHETQTCLEFVAPCDGVITLSMLGNTIQVGPNSDNGVRVAVWKNTDADLAVLPYTVISAGKTYDFAPATFSVKKGDQIRFLLTAINGNNAGDSVVMLPIIQYTSIKHRLGPDQGVYSAMDMFSGTQTDIWHYLARESVSNTYKELTWDGEKWIDSKGGIITAEWMHSSADASDKHETQICLAYIAPNDGVIQIGLEDDIIGVSQGSQNGIRFGIMQNNTMIYTYTDYTGGDHRFEPITVNVSKGDYIYFLLCPISGNNAGDSTRCMPIITYLSYEKAPDPVLEEVPDDPDKTLYNSKDDFGGYLNPWYYGYCARGSQKLELMKWNATTKFFVADGFSGLQISAENAHPYPGYDAVRVFRAPKSGTICISMNQDSITLGNGTSGAEDGVYVSIRLNDGSSVKELYPKTLVLPGETVVFDPIEVEIYEGWELWFVVNCNANNAGDSTKISPIVEYLEITQKDAPIYSNREEDTNEPSLNDLTSAGADDTITQDTPFNAIWIIVAAFVIAAVGVNIVLFLVFRHHKKK